MDLLIVEPLEVEVMRWLEARHAVRYAPELAGDPLAFRQSLHHVRAVIVPPSVGIGTHDLKQAPNLLAIGRVSAGAENIDLDACNQARVEVVRSPTSSAKAEAEFMIGALISMLRRVPVVGSDGLLVGRELGTATVGFIGMAPAARALSHMLGPWGSRLVGYDPALHSSDAMFERWRVRPVGLRGLLEQADAVCVQLSYYTRYHGLLGERFLPFCKPNQVMVSISHSGLFDEGALAEVLGSGQMSAAWLDSLEPGALEAGRPLHGVANLQITPRVASTSRESRLRSAWSVARRIDELISGSNAQGAFRSTGRGEPADFADAPSSP